MGNLSSRGPKTDKIKEIGGCNSLRYGLCEMQGWRSRMVIYKLKNRKMQR
jgi:hypothetical protein